MKYKTNVERFSSFLSSSSADSRRSESIAVFLALSFTATASIPATHYNHRSQVSLSSFPASVSHCEPESHLNGCNSWSDTWALPRESMLQVAGENVVTNCIFLFYIQVLYSFPLLRCHPSTPFYLRLSFLHSREPAAALINEAKCLAASIEDWIITMPVVG